MTRIPHVHSISVFDCPVVRLIRDEGSGNLTIMMGRITLNVYGLDPYKDVPVILQMTEEEAKAERARAYQIGKLTVSELDEEILQANKVAHAHNDGSQ